MNALKYVLYTVLACICLGFIFLGPSPEKHYSKVSGTDLQIPVGISGKPVQALASTSMTAEKSSAKITAKGKYTEYLSETRITGVIGQMNGADNPADNIFIVNLDHPLTCNKNIFLEYELFGVEDYNSISRSINDNLATGGCVVKKSDKWTKQREVIKADLLKTGKNVIRFTAPKDKDYIYMIKNVSLRVEDNPAMGERRLVVNQPTTAYYYRTFGYLQGFVEGPGSDEAVLTLNNKRVRLIHGVFEDAVSKPDQSGESWSAEVQALFADGQVLQTSIRFDKPVEWDIYNGFDKILYHTESHVQANEPFEINLQGTSIKPSLCIRN